MSKDAMTKDAMAKNAKAKDAKKGKQSKDAMKKDAMSHDAMSHDAMSKDAMSKDAIAKIDRAAADGVHPPRAAVASRPRARPIAWIPDQTRDRKVESMNDSPMGRRRSSLIAGACVVSLLQPAVHAADFLDPEDAFKFSAAVAEDGRTVEARFSIADGYYLYHERFAFVASDGVQLGTPQYPPGQRSSSTRPSTRKS